MFDPIERREIPEEWIRKSSIPSDVLKAGIESGKFLLLPDGNVLRRGFTTGTTASAASKAAVLSISESVDRVSVMTPIGIRVELPVESASGVGRAIKYAGDHEFDVTDGIEIVATARLIDKGIVIKAGKGIGRFEDGMPAINAAPMASIEEAVREALTMINKEGAEVTIEVEDGEKIAKETLNTEYGVYGGISILGTTGFVEPWNEHLEEMVKLVIERSSKVALTTGRRGANFARELLKDHEVVVIGSRFDIIREVEERVEDLILCGLPALILKWINPEILKDTGFRTVREMVLRDPDNSLIDEALQMIKDQHPALRVLLFDFDGNVLRDVK
ncbi:MAG: cobalt-precorrin-5B (C(1))-methyltransferase [Candidatus Syntropharchaeales archaeon]